jgi:hypothetical protein
MIPSKKSPVLSAFLNTINNRDSCINSNVCVFCGRSVDISSFVDSLSLEEYKISGLCQECQNDMFRG